MESQESWHNFRFGHLEYVVWTKQEAVRRKADVLGMF